MSENNPLDAVLERVEHLLLRHEELKRTNELLVNQIDTLTQERDSLKSRLQAARSRTEVIVGLVKREKFTLRQLLAYLAGARGHFTTAGTPEQIADLIEDWFTDGAADGFNLMPPLLPSMLDVFVAEVIPLLQRRGLFRTAYTGRTLREHFGLARPAASF